MIQGLHGGAPIPIAMMMKKLCMFLWLVGHTAWSKPHLRHTEGIHGVELTGGKASIGYCARGAYSAYINPHCYWKLSLGGTWHKETQASYQAFQGMPAVGVNLLQYSNVFYLNLLCGAAVSYESHKQRGNDYEGWNIVLHLGPETELFLSHNFALLISLLPSYYCLENPYGRWGYEGTIGIKITF